MKSEGIFWRKDAGWSFGACNYAESGLAACLEPRAELNARGLAVSTKSMFNTGCYSNAEIPPHVASGFCELNDQAMTSMTLSEAA